MTEPITQKDLFLSGEGDAWFERNSLSGAHQSLTSNDDLLPLLSNLPLASTSDVKVLEIGCSHGTRLSNLNSLFNWDVYGLDPSAKAIDACCSKSISATVGTADHLPYQSESFDIVILGFCLYLCDRSDLFLIASEVNRVLKKASWLAMIDFWSPYPYSNPYHHLPGVHSYKMNYLTLFTWHPSYSLYDHKVREHSSGQYTDQIDDYVSSSILRRLP